MPEVPELEIFTRNLHKKLKGKTVDRTAVYRTKRLNVSPEALNQALAGARLSHVRRDGKEIKFCFDNGRVLAVHLMLTGQFEIEDAEPDGDSQRLALHFAGGPYLIVSDYKGWATFTLDPPAPSAPDALSPKFTPHYLQETIAQSKSMTAKAFLMDQDKIGGIGNAYSDEILWASRIHPKSKCGRLPADAVCSLYDSTRTVLDEAIHFIEQENPDAVNGKIRDFLKIHNPDLKASPTGHPIHCEEINGRKCYFTDEQRMY